jgi:hypothetical protein
MCSFWRLLYFHRAQHHHRHFFIFQLYFDYICLIFYFYARAGMGWELAWSEMVLMGFSLLGWMDGFGGVDGGIAKNI